MDDCSYVLTPRSVKHDFSLTALVALVAGTSKIQLTLFLTSFLMYVRFMRGAKMTPLPSHAAPG